MKRFLTILLVASAMILISFTVNSSVSANEIQADEKPELLFAPRGGYALEDAKI